MILKNNRFFGKDLSNVPQNIPRNQSQDFCEKRYQKHSLSLAQNHKQSLCNIDTKKPLKDSDITEVSTLPSSVEESDKCVPEYFIEIFKFMRNNQNSMIGNYCEKTINIDKNSRG